MAAVPGNDVKTLERIVRSLYSDDRLERQHARDALHEMRETVDLCSRVASLLNSPECAVRIGAIHALAELAPRARNVLPAVIVALQDPDEWVRYYACWCLGDIGASESDVACAVTQLIEEPNWHLRHACAETLGRLGIRDDYVVQTLLKAAHDPIWNVRSAAVEALAELGVWNERAMSAALSSKEHCLSETAVRAMATLRPPFEIARPLLEAIANEQRTDLAAQAACLLKQLAQEKTNAAHG